MTDTPATSTPRSYRFIAYTTAATAVTLDVVTKQWATHSLADQPRSLLHGIVVLTESRNPGAAFGLGTTLTPWLTALAIVAACVVAVYAWRLRITGLAVTLGLLLGGIVGNLVDRLARAPGPGRGHVVDWIDIGSWPTFNLADSCIVVAAIGLVIISFTSRSN